MLSLNYRGLANPSKKMVFKILIEVHHTRVIFLHEMMMEGENIKSMLKNLHPPIGILSHWMLLGIQEDSFHGETLSAFGKKLAWSIYLRLALEPYLANINMIITFRAHLVVGKASRIFFQATFDCSTKYHSGR